ncbi:hypothetical protein WJX73_009215 [Symbiochloris irregularis]|uniref:Uncharacterized protein n=1 Tax=Symbiochloris irregularis TaxID=706552 RepID=A0AAW1PGM1_9CHLO
MSKRDRAGVLAFIQEQQELHSRYSSLLDRLKIELEAAEPAASADCSSLLEACAPDARSLLQQALASWESCTSQQPTAAPQQVNGTPAEAKSLHERLAALGAKPAFGGLMTMPVATPEQRRALSAVDSPAGREVAQARLGKSFSAESSSPEAKTPPSTAPAPPWLAELKSKNLPVSP